MNSTDIDFSKTMRSRELRGSVTSRRHIDVEEQLSPRARSMAEAIRQVSQRSPQITAMYRRQRKQPMGSLQEKSILALQTKATKNIVLAAANAQIAQFLPGNSPGSFKRGTSTQSVNQFAFPVSSGKPRNMTVVNKDFTQPSEEHSVGSRKDANTAKLMALLRMDEQDPSTPSSKLPPQVYKGSIKDLLSSQSLEQVFTSFKKHQLEFETFLRPLMQDVIKESEPLGDPRRSEMSWDHETWNFLQKSILNDSKVHRDLVQTEKRNRHVSKLIKLRQQQIMLQREAEKKRLDEEIKLEEQRKLEEETSRNFQQQLKSQQTRKIKSKKGSFSDHKSRTVPPITEYFSSELQSSRQQSKQTVGRQATQQPRSPPQCDAVMQIKLSRLDSGGSENELVLDSTPRVEIEKDLENEQRSQFYSTLKDRHGSHQLTQTEKKNRRLKELELLTPVFEGKIDSVSIDEEMSPQPRRTKSTRSIVAGNKFDENMSPGGHRKTQDDVKFDGSKRQSQALSQQNSPKGDSLEVFMASAPVQQELKFADETSSEQNKKKIAKVIVQSSPVMEEAAQRKVNMPVFGRDLIKPSASPPRKVEAQQKPRDNKFYGIKDQDINYVGATEQLLNEQGPIIKRIPGLSQEYKVKRSQAPTENYSFKPMIGRYKPETESKKKLIVQKLLQKAQTRGTTPQLRSLITLTKSKGQGAQGYQQNFGSPTQEENLLRFDSGHNNSVEQYHSTIGYSFQSKMPLSIEQLNHPHQTDSFFQQLSTERAANFEICHQDGAVLKSLGQHQPCSGAQLDHLLMQSENVQEQISSAMPGTIVDTINLNDSVWQQQYLRQRANNSYSRKEVAENKSASKLVDLSVYAPKVELNKLVKARMLYKAEQEASTAKLESSRKVAGNKNGSPSTVTKTQAVTTVKADKFRLPALGSMASSRAANKRSKEYDPHSQWLPNNTTPIKFTSSVTDRHTASQYASSGGFAATQEVFSLFSKTKKGPESLLEKRLRQRGISSPLLDARSEPTERKKPTPRINRVSEIGKNSVAGQLNAHYLEIVRSKLSGSQNRMAATSLSGKRDLNSSLNEISIGAVDVGGEKTASTSQVKTGQMGSLNADSQEDLHEWKLHSQQQKVWK